MKKLLRNSLYILIFGICISSCDNTNQATGNTEQDETQVNFQLVDKTKQFVKDGFGTPYVEYKYEGVITNQTQNIYKKARVRMVLEFILNNGQVLTDVDIAEAKSTFGAAEASDLIGMYKPNETYEIKDMKSNVISTDYTSYPIKSVIVKFKIQLVDEINNRDEEILVKSEDITAEWQKVVNGNVKVDE